jgi:hypothetical protein
MKRPFAFADITASLAYRLPATVAASDSVDRRCKLRTSSWCDEARRQHWSVNVRVAAIQRCRRSGGAAQVQLSLEHFANFVAEIVRRERFVEEGDTGFEDAVLDHGFLGVARHVDNPQRRSLLD